MKIKFLLPVLLFTSFFLVSCSSTVDLYKEVKIVPRSEWNAVDPKPFKSHVPERITIHHEGELLKPDEDAKVKIHNTQVWGMGPDRKWADIPYHFMIGLDGTIYEGRNVFTAGETATTYDPTGHLLITCLGNFEEQTLSKEQLDALIKLTAYCCKKYQISPETIKGHKDYAETLCPGKDLYKYIENGYIKAEVKKLLTD
ncbi:MAG TPA: peptidoglycan recognition family protein [Ignavibacteriaceae bacterium]|nr:peptidoglycan recognition family protein [Ignavibacteriaceae bacterium]